MTSHDAYEYGTNWFHKLFPPENLVHWRTQKSRALLRSIPLILTPFSLTVPAYLFNVLLFDGELSWVRVLIGIVPGFVALLGVVVMAGAFVQAVFDLESWRQGCGYMSLSVFGRPRPLRYPYAIITEGSVRQRDQDKFVVNRGLGGPGSLIIFSDSAVILERYGRITKTQGPGAVFLERFERIREILDLRPQTRTVRDALVYTKDGIAVTTDITICFQIKHDPCESPEDPYPIDQAALHAIVRCEAMRVESGKPGRFDWVGRVMGNVDSTLREIVAGKYLDELFEPMDTAKDPRDEIGREMLRRLRDNSAPLGVEMLDVILGSFKPVDTSVEQQRVASWQATRRAEVRVREAYREAQSLLNRETAYAYAQLEMMLAIDRGFRRLVSQDKRLPSYFVALRFIETLRRTATSAGVGPLLPLESIQTLEFLDRLLAAGASDDRAEESSEAHNSAT